MSDFNNNDQMLEMFLFELSSLLEQLDEILLESERNGALNEENVSEIFRIMHTIKGSSAMMDFTIIASVTHKLEDLFFYVRDNGVPQDKFTLLFDLLLKGSDFLKAEVEKIRSGEQLSGGNDALIQEIVAFLGQLSGKPAAGAATSGAAAEAAGSDDPNFVPEGEYFYRVRFTFDEDSGMENLRAYMLVHSLRSSCNISSYNPPDVDTNPSTANEIIKNGFEVELSCNLNKDELISLISHSPYIKSFEIFQHEMLRQQLQAQDSGEVAADNGAQEQADAAKAAPVIHSARPAKQNIINVNLSRLDTLMDMVGEIVITESMVTSSPDLKGLQLDHFNKAARQLRKLTSELQDIVMSIRMLPISGTFQKMVRIVRDMGRSLNKEVELEIVGENTEVDKTIIDGIGDPIMHLVRNAMDHGLEPTADRIAAGKPAKGKITLTAYNSGGEIIISVSDDGKGLDREVILEKARKNGLVTKPDSEYSDKEAFMLLSLPGFSTKENITEYSGRGVGMDVVKRNVEKIGGSIHIDSVKGQGTTVSFKIPLTLAIVDGMEISVGNGRYTIPITAIRESFKATKEQILNDVAGNEMIMIRGDCYPVMRLHELYGIDSAITDIEEGILMLVEADGKGVCLFVDQLIGELQIIVKPIPAYLAKYNLKDIGISGCTLLGDGTITLILDVASIMTHL